MRRPRYISTRFLKKKNKERLVLKNLIKKKNKNPADFQCIIKTYAAQMHGQKTKTESSKFLDRSQVSF